MKTTLLTLAALAGLSISPAAFAADAPLDQEALRTLAKSGDVLCDGWRDRDKSCEQVGFMELLPQDQVLHTYRFRVSFDPDYEVVVQETSTIENGALCSIYSPDAMTIKVLSDGVVAQTEQAQQLSALLEQTLAEYDGKQVCETYSRDAETGNLSTVVTIDGERNPDLESSYRVLDKGDRIHLRELDESADPQRQDV